jgi:hypothetical protein
MESLVYNTLLQTTVVSRLINATGLSSLSLVIQTEDLGVKQLEVPKCLSLNSVDSNCGVTQRRRWWRWRQN